MEHCIQSFECDRLDETGVRRQLTSVLQQERNVLSINARFESSPFVFEGRHSRQCKNLRWMLMTVVIRFASSYWRISAVAQMPTQTLDMIAEVLKCLPSSTGIDKSKSLTLFFFSGGGGLSTAKNSLKRSLLLIHLNPSRPSTASRNSYPFFASHCLLK